MTILNSSSEWCAVFEVDERLGRKSPYGVTFNEVTNRSGTLNVKGLVKKEFKSYLNKLAQFQIKL